MSIDEFAESNGISEILHFTTSTGFLGICASQLVLSRKRLPENQYVEHIYRPNTPIVRDVEHIDYVNLSITQINSRLFNFSANKWHKHERLFWCILSFSPEILNHDGVIFVSTNNMYGRAQRDCGLEGLCALFDEPIPHGYSMPHCRRYEGMPANHTTCRQAEVLYPGELPIKYLEKVYVKNNDDRAAIKSYAKVCGTFSGPVEIRPDLFELGPDRCMP
jgi:hypothetical protein